MIEMHIMLYHHQQLTILNKIGTKIVKVEYLICNDDPIGICDAFLTCNLSTLHGRNQSANMYFNFHTFMIANFVVQ